MDDAEAQLVVSAGGDARALGSFYAWLTRTPEVARPGAVRAVPARGDGSMNALETVCVVVNSAATVANVLIAYANWRRTRATPAAMTVTLGPVTVAIDDADAREKLAAALSGREHAS